MQPYSRVIVRGLWRLVVLSGLLWLLLPARGAQAQPPESVQDATPLVAPVE